MASLSAVSEVKSSNMISIVVKFDTDRRVGPWIARAEVVDEAFNCSKKNYLAQKAMRNMDHLMDGNIEYFIESPSWERDGFFEPRPLVFYQFKKSFRPIAWKSSDLKVQSILPLLGNDDTANGAMKNPMVHMKNGKEQENPSRLVKVVIKLDRQ
jgi:hypothetical protein